MPTAWATPSVAQSLIWAASLNRFRRPPPWECPDFRHTGPLKRPVPCRVTLSSGRKRPWPSPPGNAGLCCPVHRAGVPGAGRHIGKAGGGRRGGRTRHTPQHRHHSGPGPPWPQAQNGSRPTPVIYPFSAAEATASSYQAPAGTSAKVPAAPAERVSPAVRAAVQSRRHPLSFQQFHFPSPARCGRLSDGAGPGKVSLTNVSFAGSYSTTWILQMYELFGNYKFRTVNTKAGRARRPPLSRKRPVHGHQQPQAGGAQHAQHQGVDQIHAQPAGQGRRR